MNNERALSILKPLSEGVNPWTGDVLPNAGPFQNSEVIRALFFAIRVLESEERRPPRKTEPPSANGKLWTQQEDSQLISEFHEAVEFKDIAASHERTRGAIVSRLVHLGELKQRDKH
jgi:hypothetical protein